MFGPFDAFVIPAAITLRIMQFVCFYKWPNAYASAHRVLLYREKGEHTLSHNASRHSMSDAMALFHEAIGAFYNG